jgi:hypothetical protein
MVCGPYVVTLFNPTPVVEWYMTTRVVRNGLTTGTQRHQGCIMARLHKLVNEHPNYLGSVVNAIGNKNLELLVNHFGL